jgi:hypothetical protein
VASTIYLRPRDVAQRLGVKVDVVLSWIHSLALRAINVAERDGRRPRWRIAESDLEIFLLRRSVPTVPVRRRRRRRPASDNVIQFYRHGKRVDDMEVA